jgi:hypothetical protein
MSLRNDAEYMTGVEISKIIPLNTDGSTVLPYPGKTDVAAYSGLGPFDFSGASSPAAVPLTIKVNTVAETKTIDITTASDQSAVTVTELMAAITTAAFTGITAAADSRGYGKISVGAGDAETDYLQVYGEAALLGDFGYGYGMKFRTLNTQKSFPLTPVNVDDESIETIDSRRKKTRVIYAGYRDGVTGSLVDSAVDNDLRALLTGGSWDATTKEFVAPLADAVKPKVSIEVQSYLYLKNSNQENDWIAAKVTRAFNMSSKEDGSGDGSNNFQDMSYSFNGTEYLNPVDSTKLGDSMTKDYTRAAFEALNYGDI